MRTPNSAAEEILIETDDGKEASDKSFVENPYYGKKFLSPLEAVDLINKVSGILFAYEVSQK